MKILVLGHGEHGKDTVGDYLVERLGLTATSSSWAFAQIAYEALSPILGYTSLEQCYNDRRNWRDLWYQLICAYNHEDKSKLCKLILSESDIYVGLRCDKEYEASKHLFDVVIWVDASKRKPLEETMKIEYDDSMIYVDNNGTESDLYLTLDALISNGTFKD